MMSYLNFSHDSQLILSELYVWVAGIAMNLNVNCMYNYILSYCI